MHCAREIVVPAQEVRELLDVEAVTLHQSPVAKRSLQAARLLYPLLSRSEREDPGSMLRQAHLRREENGTLPLLLRSPGKHVDQEALALTRPTQNDNHASGKKPSPMKVKVRD